MKNVEKMYSIRKNVKLKMYSINFAEKNKKTCLNLHYNKENSYLFANGTEIHKFKS